MNLTKTLIVNADDFGLSEGVNRGVVEAHERGIVTSASLMVRWPAAEAAAQYGRDHPKLGLGLHIDLGEWAYRDGQWRALYRVVDESDAVGVRAEVERQIEAFGRLTGCAPTHIDSHQHVHRSEPVRTIALGVAAQLGVPLRHFAAGVAYRGDFYGQSHKAEACHAAISVESLTRIITGLQEGVTELACHPGYADELDTDYRLERALEVRSLCDPAVLEAIKRAGISLRTFADLR